MYRSSTIRTKIGTCAHPSCNYFGPLTNKLCPTHYWNGVRLKSVERADEREIQQNESLSSVMEDLDAVFSQFIRLRDSDENGYMTCPCCKAVLYWTEGDCMHYMKRTHQNTRYSEENCYGGCKTCNQYKSGNYEKYGEFIESNRPGGVEYLEEQARVRYDYSVSELKGLISFYSKEVNKMKKTKPLKL